MGVWRYGGSVLLGGCAALGLFVLMQRLIIPDTALTLHTHGNPALEFVRLKREPAVSEAPRRIRPKPLSEAPPEPIRVPAAGMQAAGDLPQIPMMMQLPPLQHAGRFAKGPTLPAAAERKGTGLAEMTAGAPELTVGDAELMPLVRINPVYPPHLRRMKVEGYVTARLHVDRQGDVAGVEIVASKPEGRFDATVIQALKRWKFRPKCVDGVNIAYNGIVTIEFRLLK